MRHLVTAAICVAAMTLPALSASGEELSWSCRNNDLEISCNHGKCEVAEAHTAMDVHLSRDEISVCAYSGCWAGKPSAIVQTGAFLTFAGTSLPFSTNPEDLADVSVTIATKSHVATILVAGGYATPAVCEPK